MSKIYAMDANEAMRLAGLIKQFGRGCLLQRDSEDAAMALADEVERLQGLIMAEADYCYGYPLSEAERSSAIEAFEVLAKYLGWDMGGLAAAAIETVKRAEQAEGRVEAAFRAGYAAGSGVFDPMPFEAKQRDNDLRAFLAAQEEKS